MSGSGPLRGELHAGTAEGPGESAGWRSHGSGGRVTASGMRGCRLFKMTSVPPR
ncbi:Hypothetical protein SMAX5B_001753, partial [Scophthalmus maximus]